MRNLFKGVVSFNECKSYGACHSKCSDQKYQETIEWHSSPIHTTYRFIPLSSNRRFQTFFCFHTSIVLNLLHITCLGLMTGWSNKFSSTSIEIGYFIFWCATLFCLFPSAMSSHKWRIKRMERAVLAKLLIANIDNEATGMLSKSELLEAYPSEGFRWNWVEPIGMKPNVVWTRVKSVLFCSVDRSLVYELTETSYILCFFFIVNTLLLLLLVVRFVPLSRVCTILWWMSPSMQLILVSGCVCMCIAY